MLDVIEAIMSGICHSSVWNHITFLLDWNILNCIQFQVFLQKQHYLKQHHLRIFSFNEFSDQK